MIVADDVPAEDELLALYDSVGWSAYTRAPAVLAAAVRGSSFVVAARSPEGRLDGLARAVSDGATICYLQDVLVRPDARRAGLGTALVQAVLDRYAAVRQTVLITDDEPGQQAFYAALGFRELSTVADGSLRCHVRLAGSTA